MDIDIGKFRSTSIFTKVAKSVMGVVLPVLKGISIDIAFMFQGDSEEELPERIYGSVRVAGIDLLKDGGTMGKDKKLVDESRKNTRFK